MAVSSISVPKEIFEQENDAAFSEMTHFFTFTYHQILIIDICYVIMRYLPDIERNRLKECLYHHYSESMHQNPNFSIQPFLDLIPSDLIPKEESHQKKSLQFMPCKHVDICSNTHAFIFPKSTSDEEIFEFEKILREQSHPYEDCNAYAIHSFSQMLGTINTVDNNSHSIEATNELVVCTQSEEQLYRTDADNHTTRNEDVIEKMHDGDDKSHNLCTIDKQQSCSTTECNFFSCIRKDYIKLIVLLTKGFHEDTTILEDTILKTLLDLHRRSKRKEAHRLLHNISFLGETYAHCLKGEMGAAKQKNMYKIAAKKLRKCQHYLFYLINKQKKVTDRLALINSKRHQNQKKQEHYQYKLYRLYLKEQAAQCIYMYMLSAINNLLTFKSS